MQKIVHAIFLCPQFFLEILCGFFDWLNAPVLFALSLKVCYDWSHHHTHLSLAEQRFLANASGQASDAWVGLHKKPETGVWKWSGGIDAEQISWDPAFNQPNNLDNENSGILHLINQITLTMKTVAFYTKPIINCMMKNAISLNPSSA
uniref:C-type lectin domain-containing protein n=1 Tax=Sinocyclocheilus grahami TaxID=75366 RepID=A0A672LUE2_SINGR